jgi:hypothetical protein
MLIGIEIVTCFTKIDIQHSSDNINILFLLKLHEYFEYTKRAPVEKTCAIICGSYIPIYSPAIRDTIATQNIAENKAGKICDVRFITVL